MPGQRSEQRSAQPRSAPCVERVIEPAGGSPLANDRAELLGHVVPEDSDQLGVELFRERVEVLDDVIRRGAIHPGLADERAQQVLRRGALGAKLQSLLRYPYRGVDVSGVAEQFRRDFQQVEPIPFRFLPDAGRWRVGRQRVVDGRPLGDVAQES